MSKSMSRIDEMTRQEFADLMANDPVVLLPLGSLEQHGPACPMGDYRLATKLAEEVALRTGAIVAPTLPFGHANYFKCVPGGISLSADTFTRVLDDMCRAYTGHGIGKILILNGHGGNRFLINQVTHSIRVDTGFSIPAVNLWGDIPDRIWDKAHPGIGKKAFGHGGDPIASLTAYLFPDDLREDKRSDWTGNNEIRGLKTTSISTVSFNEMTVHLPLTIDDISPSGVTRGGTLHASPEAGRIFFEYLAGNLAEFIQDFWADDLPEKHDIISHVSSVREVGR